MLILFRLSFPYRKRLHLFRIHLKLWINIVTFVLVYLFSSYFFQVRFERISNVLDEIWDLIESVSEGFLTYSFIFVHRFGADLYLCKYLYQCKKTSTTF